MQTTSRGDCVPITLLTAVRITEHGDEHISDMVEDECNFPGKSPSSLSESSDRSLFVDRD